MKRLNQQQLVRWLFQYRYGVAFAVIVIGVLLSLNGSSIGMWSNYIGQSELDNVLLGVSRGIRSDEWATFTPLAFSQASQTVPFPYFNESVRAVATDMFIVYGQPVWHFGMIFRPSHIGYLLFGMERGLSFFWVFRTVWLFMSMFELGLVITQKKKRLSLILAILITFSPVVQWWFAVNGLVEMLASGAMAVVLFERYLKSTQYFNRFFLALGLAWVGGIYILTFYPAWQVPIAYIILALMVFLIWDNVKRIMWSWKKDTLILSFALLLMCIGVGVVLWQSKDTLASVLNTDYPGQRVETGGKWGHVLFDSPLSIFYTLTGLTWERGMDVMYDCLPLTILLSAWVWKKTKDKLLSVLAIVNVFFWVYITFGFPKILAKATLMSYSFGMRVVAPFGIVTILMLIRTLSLNWQLNKPIIKKYSFILSSVAVVLAVTLHADYFDVRVLPFDTTMIMVIVGCITFPVVYVLYKNILNRRLTNVLLIVSIASLFFGGMVNPLRQGIRVIEDNTLIQTIKQVHLQNEGIWIVDDMMYPYSNIPLLAGVPSINVTNVYPNVSRWAQFDSDLSDKSIYNRYAHIHLKIDTIDKVDFTLTLPDSFTAVVNPSHLQMMNVKYILSQRELSQFNNDQFIFRQKAVVNGFTIYELMNQ